MSSRKQEAWESANDRYWQYFREVLSNLDDYKEARDFAYSGPGPDQPGRKYHSNLAFFLERFYIPGGSNSTERALYLKFLRKIDKAGQLKPGSLAELEKQFNTNRD